MKPWAQIEQDPAYTSAPLTVKREVRQATLQDLEWNPDFQALSHEEQEEVRAHILGGYPTAIQTAAHLIAASLTGEVERVLLEKGAEGLVPDLLAAASAAEKALDVPLKDRKPEKFPDLAHFHIDKQLRALLCFIEEGLPEYRAYRRWQTRSGLPLREQIQQAVKAGRDGMELPPIGAEPAAPIPHRETIHSVVDLERILVQVFPGVPAETLRLLASGQDVGDGRHLAAEKLLRDHPEAALKLQLPEQVWPRLDAQVLTVVGQSLSGAGDALGSEATPGAVQAVVHAVTERAYEALARTLFPPPPVPIQGPSRPLPIAPAALAEYLLGAAAAGPAAAEMAAQFPFYYLVDLDLCDVPQGEKTPYQQVQAQAAEAIGLPPGTFLPLAALAQGIQTGQVSLIALSGANTALLEAALREQGVPLEARGNVQADLAEAGRNPALAALVAASAAEAQAAFQVARTKAMRQVSEETQKVLRPPKGQTRLSPEAEASTTPTTPLHDALAKNPISKDSIKALGLSKEFQKYGISAAQGMPLEKVLSGLTAMRLLPSGAGPMELLDSLDKEEKESKTVRVGASLAGRVQGVHFRKHAETSARSHGLGGMARNEGDGTLTVEAEGGPDNVRQFLLDLQVGPERARVDQMSVHRLPTKNQKDFQVDWRQP